MVSCFINYTAQDVEVLSTDLKVSANSKQYHKEVQLNSFHLNCHTLGFDQKA